MSSVEGIPSYVLQNMAMIQENLKSVMADNVGIGSSNSEFDSFLDSAIGDIKSTFSDSGFEDNVRYVNGAYDLPGTSGNTSSKFNPSELMRNTQVGEKPNLSNQESTETVKKAYDSLLNGDMAEQLSPKIASLDSKPSVDKVDKLKNVSSNNTSLITDEEFFDAESLTPQQITDILKRKGSPYAYQTFEGGKSIGQLIYDECRDAGSVQKGPNTLNPALIISIMGAESSFGTDNRARKDNPFNIRLNGSFDKVKTVEQSLNIAVNTMYNWAVNRPANSKLSYLDYAGDKYCEDYTKEWKPNVEKYFTEFTVLNSSPSVANKVEDQKTKLLNQMVSSLSNSNPMLKGMNMENLMKSATVATGQGNQAQDQMIAALSSANNPMLKGIDIQALMKSASQNGVGQNMMANMNMMPGLNPSSMMEEENDQ